MDCPSYAVASNFAGAANLLNASTMRKIETGNGRDSKRRPAMAFSSSCISPLGDRIMRGSGSQPASFSTFLYLFVSGKRSRPDFIYMTPTFGGSSSVLSLTLSQKIRRLSNSGSALICMGRNGCWNLSDISSVRRGQF